MNSSSNYKSTSSELSMLMGSQNLESQHQPKLENFLGRHSFGHQETAAAYNNTGDHYMFNNNPSLQLPSDGGGGGGGGGTIHNNNSSIGLSMIKTWLRNQPAPPAQAENKINDGGAISSAQTLSLSMSTGSQSSSTLPLLTASSAGGGGSGGESSSSDNNKQAKTTTTGVDTQTGAIEAAPRKSIDTFGQRTSIYRGVTRCVVHIYSLHACTSKIYIYIFFGVINFFIIHFS